LAKGLRKSLNHLKPQSTIFTFVLGDSEPGLATLPLNIPSRGEHQDYDFALVDSAGVDRKHCNPPKESMWRVSVVRFAIISRCSDPMRLPARLRAGASDGASAESCTATSAPLKDKSPPFGEDHAQTFGCCGVTKAGRCFCTAISIGIRRQYIAFCQSCSTCQECTGWGAKYLDPVELFVSKNAYTAEPCTAWKPVMKECPLHRTRTWVNIYLNRTEHPHFLDKMSCF
jgi:hypothetical protein